MIRAKTRRLVLAAIIVWGVLLLLVGACSTPTAPKRERAVPCKCRCLDTLWVDTLSSTVTKSSAHHS